MKTLISDKRLKPDENDELPVSLFLELAERGAIVFHRIQEENCWKFNSERTITPEELKENHSGEKGWFRFEYMDKEKITYEDGTTLTPYKIIFCVMEKEKSE